MNMLLSTVPKKVPKMHIIALDGFDFNSGMYGGSITLST